MNDTKAKIMMFPSTTKEPEFNNDQVIELAERLRIGTSGAKFGDSELDFIESWGGDDSSDTGTFYDAHY